MAVFKVDDFRITIKGSRIYAYLKRRPMTSVHQRYTERTDGRTDNALYDGITRLCNSMTRVKMVH